MIERTVTNPFNAELVETQVHDVFDARQANRRKSTMRNLRRKGTEKAKALHSVIRKLHTVPFDRVEAIVDQVDESLHAEDGQSRARILPTILDARDSLTLFNYLRNSPIDNSQIQSLLQHDGLHPLIGTMLESSHEHRAPLGLIFSYTALPEYPDNVRSAFYPKKTNKSISLSPFEEGWYLCDEMEGILRRSRKNLVTTSLEDDSDPLLLVNFRVKMTGLCLEDFVTENGSVLFRGNFYSPSDTKGRSALYAACDADRAKIPLDEGTWVFMRPSRKSISLDNYADYARSLPDVYDEKKVKWWDNETGKTHKIPRSEYRQIQKEDYV